MTSPDVMLPPMFELVEVGTVDDVLSDAARRAEAGAEEGIVVWANAQRSARSVGGADWFAPSGNLHCALVLEPEYPNASLGELGIVATVAAGEALATLLEPMTGLRYRWPGTLLINELVAGQVRLEASVAPTDPVPWLVVGLSVNVEAHPPNPEPERYNSVHASGSPHVTVEHVLEDFCRFFLRWINIWAEDGFEPVRRQFEMRMDRGSAAPGSADAAAVVELDSSGTLFVDGQRHTLAAAFGLPR